MVSAGMETCVYPIVLIPLTSRSEVRMSAPSRLLEGTKRMAPRTGPGAPAVGGGRRRAGPHVPGSRSRAEVGRLETNAKLQSWSWTNQSEYIPEWIPDLADPTTVLYFERPAVNNCTSTDQLLGDRIQ